MRSNEQLRKAILNDIKNGEGGFVSGQALCEKYGVTRTAVWKHIASLKSEGYVFDATCNRGYRLLFEPDAMSAESIAESLNTNVIGKTIHYFDEVDSTNLQAKLAADEGEPHGSLYVANKQGAGRGRQGRAWETPKGTSAAMSIVLRPTKAVDKVAGITIIAAVAVAKAIAEVSRVTPQIKWPNDVVANGKKLCGILTEMSSEGMNIKHVIVGIGLNVAMEEFPEEIADKATSIKLETGEAINRSKLVAAVTNHFERLYDQFTAEDDLSFIKKEYDAILANKDKQVYVIDGDTKTQYTALGLDSNGGLLVADESGETTTIISGEVSVRGIYGYV